MTVIRIAAAALMLVLAGLPARAVGVDLASRNLEIGATALFEVPMLSVVPGAVGVTGFGPSTGGTGPIGTFVSGVATAPFGDSDFILAIGTDPTNAIDGTSDEVALDMGVVEVLFQVTNKTGVFAGLSDWILGRGALPMGTDPTMLPPVFTVDAQLFEATRSTVIPLPAAFPLLGGGLAALALVARRRAQV
jgi:hypothetical protein